MRDARARLIVEALPDAGAEVHLSRSETAHARARRLAPGDSVVLVDGSGREARGVFVTFSGGGAVVSVRELVEAARGGPELTLLAAGLRAERLAWLVEKATELGATRIVLVASRRTQSFRSGARVLPRLESVARAAAKQSNRADWPSLGGPIDLDRALAEETARHRFFLDVGGERFPRRIESGAAAVAVGPEGGWTDAERRSALERGWTRTALPAGVLRAETAAVVSLALVRAAMEVETGEKG